MANKPLVSLKFPDLSDTYTVLSSAVMADEFSAQTAYDIGDYVFYNNSIYRFTAAHSAGAWVGTDATEVQLADDVDELRDGALALTASLTTSLASGTDFDTLLDGGSFKISSQSAAASMSNCPATDGGRLIVFQSSAQARVFQFYVTNGASCRVYFRWYGSTSTWSAWKSFANSDDTAALSSRLDVLEGDLTAAIPFSDDGSGYINYSDGSTGTSSNYNHTDYIDVSGCTRLLYKQAKSTSSSSSVGMAFYNASKTIVDGEKCVVGQESMGYVSGLKSIDVPSDAVYARFSIYADTTTYGNFELYGLMKATVIDSNLSSTSKNPVQNKVVKEAIDDAVNVYWATYGTTTLAELQAAWADGKTILISYQGNVYYLSSVTGNNNSSFVFRCPNWSTNGRAQLYELMNSYGTWNYSAYEGSDYILAPSSPATGAFLVWNGSAWTAQTLSTWSGGSY